MSAHRELARLYEIASGTSFRSIFLMPLNPTPAFLPLLHASHTPHLLPPSLVRCQVTDPYLNLFRNLIPPLMGQIDFTPIFGFMVLQFLVQVLGAECARCD